MKPTPFFAIIERYANRFFTVLILLICVIAFYLGPKVLPAYKDVINSVTTSLFASLIFAFIYSSVVERHHMDAINDELSQSVRRTVDEMKQLQQENMQHIVDLTLTRIEELEKSYYHEITTHFRELIPVEHFPPTNHPDPRFNSTLNAALAKSHQYLFKGVTGRYISSRLAMVGHHNLICKVLLIDPRRQDLLRLYIRDRFGVASSNIEMSSRIQEVQQEIYMTVVDLFDQAKRTYVEIRIYDGPVFYRTEIFDEKMFISYFTTRATTAFPTTYLYLKDSFFYNAYLTDFNQTFELSSPSKVFNSASTEQDLLNFLVSIGGDSQDMAYLRREAEQFRQKFLSEQH